MARKGHWGAEWQSVTNEVEVTYNYAPLVIDTSVKHGGAASWKISGAIATTVYAGIQHLPGFNITNHYIRWYTRIHTLESSTWDTSTVLISHDLFDASGNCAATYVVTNDGGQLKAFLQYNNWGTTVSLGNLDWAADTWHRVEMYFNNTGVGSTDTIKIRIDGTEVFSATDLDLTVTPTSFQCGVYNGTAGTISGTEVNFDDIAINDTTGAINNSWCGEGKIVILTPSGAGDSAATAGTYSCINEIPPTNTATSGSTMIELDSNGDVGDYIVSSPSTAGIGNSDTINAVSVLARIREEAAGTSSYRLGIKSASGGTVAQTTAADGGNATPRTNPAGTTAFGKPLISETDPTTGSRWTTTGDNSLTNMHLAVYNVDSDSTPDLWCLSLCAMVDFTPATGSNYFQTFSETVTATDTLTKLPSRNLFESISTTATAIKQDGRNLLETLTIIDVNTKLRTAFLTLMETIAISEALTKLRTVYKSLVEEVITSDTVSHLWAVLRTYTETVTIADTIIKQCGKLLDEIVLLADTIVNIAGKVLYDVVTSTDLLIRSIRHDLAEMLITTDSFASIRDKLLDIMETITYADTLVKQLQRTFEDPISSLDSLVRAIGKTRTETITLTDSLFKVSGRMFSESIVCLENLIRSTSRTLSESVILTDLLEKLKLFATTLIESIGIADSFQSLKVMVVIFSESMSVKDMVWRRISRLASVWSKVTSGVASWVKSTTTISSWTRKTTASSSWTKSSPTSSNWKKDRGEGNL